MRYLLLSLTLTASISPLLTFAHLFQIKEWRWDRLREHLCSEGYMRQLFGFTRPGLLGFFGTIGFFGIFPFWILALLGSMTLLNAMQAILGKQPLPVWTKRSEERRVGK